MTSWHTNAVRVPLNEDCWLGINGVNPAYSGTTYQQAIANYVGLPNQDGLVALLELHWSAPGTAVATGQGRIGSSTAIDSTSPFRRRGAVGSSRALPPL